MNKAEIFNVQNGVGIMVTYYPVKNNDGTIWHKDGKRTTTRSEAFMSESGYPVIFLTGISGYVSLDHVVCGNAIVDKDGPCYSKTFEHRW